MHANDYQRLQKGKEWDREKWKFIHFHFVMWMRKQSNNSSIEFLTMSDKRNHQVASKATTFFYLNPQIPNEYVTMLIH